MAPPLPNSAHTETSPYLQNAAKARGFERSFHVRRWRPNWLAGHTPWLALKSMTVSVSDCNIASVYAEKAAHPSGKTCLGNTEQRSEKPALGIVTLAIFRRQSRQHNRVRHKSRLLEGSVQPSAARAHH